MKASGESLQGALSKEEYQRIRSELAFEPNTWAVVLTIALNALLCAVGLWLLEQDTVAGYLLAQLIFPVVFFQGFSILHDCGHGSCAPRKWQNAVIGHYASLLCFMPYFPWKYQHALHHAWTGHLENDPILKVLRDWRRTGKIHWLLRFSWRTWLPLSAAVQHLVFWSHPIQVWRQGTRSQLLQCAFSVLWMAAAYVALHMQWPDIFTIANFAPAIVIYLAAVELVNMPHHVGRPTSERKLAVWEQGYATRSCYYPRGLSEFFVLNFNFHIEHHLFPTLPWYRLRRARNLVKAALGDSYEEAVGIEWNLENRALDIRRVADVSRPAAAGG